MTKRQIMEKIPFKLLAVFLLLAAGISAGGFVFYKQQRAKSVAHIQEDLNTIAQLKSDEITSWRRERYGDAYVLTRSQQFAHAARNWYQNPGDKKLKEYIYKRLDAFRIYETYKDVILVDPAGKARMFIDQGRSENLSQATLDIVNQAERQNRIIFSDFYYCGKCREVHLDVVAPLHDGEINAGAIILRINPDKYLYPLIQRWPSVSKSGETVLIRREGEEVVYINELRHKKGAAMHLRLPLSDATLPAAMAARGKEGMVEGTDYRGVQVVASVKHIAESPWYMVTKMDQEEIYAPLRRQAAGILFMVVLTIILLAAVLSFIWQADRRGFYKKQYQMELDKQALIRHYDYLTKYANDIIFLLDQDRRIVEINDRGVEAYGYSKEELLGREAGLIRAEGQREKFRAQMEELKAKGALLYETMHRKKDGTTFPVEISARTIEIEGKNYLQGIVRDITERKQYELKIQDRTEELEATNEQLMASEEELKAAEEELKHNLEELLASQTRFSHLFQGINSGVAVYRAVADGADFIFDDFNPAGQRMDNKTRDEVIGKKVTEVFPGIKGMGLFEVFQRVWRTGQPENHPVSLYQDDHLTGWRENYVYKLPTGELVSIYEDLTEQKQAEITLKNSEAKLRRFYESEMLGVIYWNTEGVITDANDKFLEITGYTREDLTAGRVDWVNMTPPEFRYLDENSLAELKSSGYNKTPFEKEYIRKDGTRVPILLAGAMVDEARVNGVAFVLDITERKRAEGELKKTQELLKNAYRLAHIGAWSWVAETDTVTWTEELYSIAGRDPNMPAPTYTEHPTLYTSESWDRLKAAVDKAMATGAEYQLELELIRPDGTTRWINAFGGATKNGQGNIIGLFGTVQDITERKQSEAKIIENEQKFRQLAENIDMVFWLTDWTEKKLLYVNQAYEKVFGLTVKSAYSDRLGWKKAVHPDDQEWVSRELQKHALNEEFTELEYRIICKGTVKWIHEQAFPLKDETGKVIRFINVADDITDRKLAEEARLVSELQYRRLFEAAKDGILILNAETGIINDANPFIKDLLGHSREEIVGKELWQIGMFNDIIANRKNLMELKEKRYVRYEDLPLMSRDGQKKEVEFVSNVYSVGDHEVIQCNIRDISERKQAEEKMRTQLAELQQWQSVMLNREDRVMELKDEVNRLLKELGRPEAYGPNA